MTKTGRSKKLNLRQSRFVELFTGGMEAGRAYEKAGYSSRGATADSHASRLLARNGKVWEAVAEERARMRERARMSKDDAVDWLCLVLRTPVGEINENHVLAQEVTIDEMGESLVRKKVKMVPKMEAMEKLARMLGWYEPERHEVDLEIVIGGGAGEA